MKTLLAVGLGYSAKEIARRLAGAGDSARLPLPGEASETGRNNPLTHPPAAGALSREGRGQGSLGVGGTSPLSSPVSLEGERRAFALGSGQAGLGVGREPALSPGGRGRREAPGEGESGWHVAGTARGAESLEAIRALGYEALPFTGDAPEVELARAIGDATHLLISAAPDEAGDPLLAQHRADLEAAPNLQWIGYLSTIGVYGDHRGAWVDETTTPRPVSERSRWRLEAEQAWEDFAAARGLPVQIFRLAGIYGPGRNPLERMKAGRERTIVKPGQVFNRIHVADIATTVIAGMEQFPLKWTPVERKELRQDKSLEPRPDSIGSEQAPEAGARAAGVFNVTDDEPAAPEDVAAYAAALLGIEPPPLVPWEEAEKTMTPMARSFYSETKRVRNERIKRELGVRLAFPTYREGLGALAKE